jgi:hypothetical protein
MSAAPHTHAETPHRRRILVLANETVEGQVLHDAIRSRAWGEPADVLVIAPALNSRVRHWTSDEDAARRAAELRLGRSIGRLAAAGVDAEGIVGDADPWQAITDGLRLFGPDELIIATQPEGRSHWLERNLIARARARLSLPILHVVVDLALSREYVASAA